MTDDRPRPPFGDWPVTEETGDLEVLEVPEVPDERSFAPIEVPPESTPAAGPAPPEPDSWRRPQGRRLLIVGAMVLAFAVGALAVVVTGRNSSDRSASPPAQNPVRPLPTPGGGAGPALQVDPDQSALAQLVVQPNDVGPPQTVVLLPGGDRVVGETTLDLCNGAYGSEALRSARLQVAEGDANTNRTALSTEAVLYQSSSGTTQAFAELQKVAASCPTTPVPSPVGGPTVQTTFSPRPDTAWPQTPTVERTAYDFFITDDQGLTQHSVAVYLRRGRALVGVYFPHADGAQPPVAGKTSIPDIVAVFATRLARLPDSVVNRSVPGASLS
jgi:hypothetical protein